MGAACLGQDVAPAAPFLRGDQRYGGVASHTSHCFPMRPFGSAGSNVCLEFEVTSRRSRHVIGEIPARAKRSDHSETTSPLPQCLRIGFRFSNFKDALHSLSIDPPQRSTKESRAVSPKSGAGGVRMFGRARARTWTKSVAALSRIWVRSRHLYGALYSRPPRRTQGQISVTVLKSALRRCGVVLMALAFRAQTESRHCPTTPPG